MKHWVIRFAVGTLPDLVIVADQCEVSAAGVAAFYAEVPDPRTAGHQNRFPDRIQLVRAFGVGQWRDVEPLAGPPEPDPEAGVIRGARGQEDEDIICQRCPHRRQDHSLQPHGACLQRGCPCGKFTP